LYHVSIIRIHAHRDLFAVCGGSEDPEIGWRAYAIPIHCLEPFENETRYFSNGGAPAGRFSSQRSGWNLIGSGKMDGFWWMCTDVMPVGVY
jgi:hypothetical protein